MRVIDIDTPLEPNKLLFYRMTGHEELSRLSEFELDLLSLDPKVNLDDVLGQTVTIKVALPDDKVRYINGYVTRLSQGSMHGRYYTYRASVRPWLWFLTRTKDCRIFQEKNVPDILKEVFNDHAGIVDVKFELTESYGPWEYCVQYRETDFNFVSRLMECEGIYYFFKHDKGKHTLVIADSYSAHPMAENAEVPFIDPLTLVRPERDQVSEWYHWHELQPGKWASTDYDFEKPNVSLEVKDKLKRKHAMAEYEIFDYPGDYIDRKDGAAYARTRMEEIQAKFARVEGATNAKSLAPGYLFKLTSHGRDDQNGEYLMISADYDIRTSEYETGESSGADYRCRFTAMKSDQPFRAERLTPKPIVQGPQTAITVGPSGETIHTDKFGRVKVQFHWDRYGKKDDKSSCWIRVSQNWGGKGWGGMFIPHVKQEVIVQFLEGDPDSPMITGRVYNAENMPPVALPAGKTQSIIRDHGGNEINMEGDGGKQRIIMHSPHSNTFFTIGDARNPPAGISAWTNLHWNAFAGGNYDWVVKGNSTTQVFGFYIQHVVGSQDNVVLGVATTVVLGAAKIDVTAALMLDYARGIRWVRSPKVIEMASSIKADVDDRVIRKINDEVKKINTEIEKFNSVVSKVSGAMNESIGALKREVKGTLNERLGPIERKVASIQDNISGLLKATAGTINLESKGSMTLKSKGSTTLDNPTTYLEGKVHVAKDLTVVGNTFGFGSGVFVAKK